MSSTQLAKCGKTLLTQRPHSPCCVKLEGAFHHRKAGRSGDRLDPLARIELLSVQLDELGLVVERVALADAAVHEELNDALGLGPVVQPAIESRARRRRTRARQRAGRARAGAPTPTGRTLRPPAAWPGDESLDSHRRTPRLREFDHVHAEASRNEQELVAVEDQTAKVFQAVARGVGGEGPRLARRGGSA